MDEKANTFIRSILLSLMFTAILMSVNCVNYEDEYQQQYEEWEQNDSLETYHVESTEPESKIVLIISYCFYAAISLLIIFTGLADWLEDNIFASLLIFGRGALHLRAGGMRILAAVLLIVGTVYFIVSMIE